MMLTGVASPKKTLNQRFYFTMVTPDVEWMTVQLFLNTKYH